MPWPEDEERRYEVATEEERFDRLEKLLRRSKKQRQSVAVRGSDLDHRSGGRSKEIYI